MSRERGSVRTRTLRLRPQVYRVVDMETIWDDDLSRGVRTGSITPDDALQMLKDNKVLVWPEEPRDAETTWGDVEMSAHTDIHNALRAVGAAHLSDAVSAEYVRLRGEGLTMDRVP